MGAKIIAACMVMLVLSMGSSLPTFAQGPEYCKPDCLSDNWSAENTHFVYIGTCTLAVKYAQRRACDTYWDFQIRSIERVGGGPITTCHPSGDLATIIDIVTEQMIIDNPMGFPPYSAPNCEDNWRVVKGSCWRSTYTTGGVEMPQGNPDILEPCDTAICCLDRFQVCIVQVNGVDQRQVTHLTTRPQEPCNQSGCVPVCGYGAR